MRDLIKKEGKTMNEELTKTILSLCSLITYKTGRENYMEGNEIAELTKALAELVKAKAKVLEN